MPFQFRKEAIEEDLNTNFPSQGQGNPPLYYSLSEVVVPTYNINNVATGSSLPQNLQEAWDFSTGFENVTGAGTSTLINNTGFWKVDLTLSFQETATVDNYIVRINSGLTTKIVWQMRAEQVGVGGGNAITDGHFVVFLRSGDSLEATGNSNGSMSVWYRQIADINGNLVNPLGFSAA